MFAKVLVFAAVAACAADANIVSHFNEAWANHLYRNLVPGVITMGPMNTVKIVPVSEVASSAAADNNQQQVQFTFFSPMPGVRCFRSAGSNAGQFMAPIGPLGPMGNFGGGIFRGFRSFGRFRSF